MVELAFDASGRIGTARWLTRDEAAHPQEEREPARSFLPFLGGDDPRAATDVPRSRVEQGPPPTYDLSDETNTP